MFKLDIILMHLLAFYFSFKMTEQDLDKIAFMRLLNLVPVVRRAPENQSPKVISISK